MLTTHRILLFYKVVQFGYAVQNLFNLTERSLSWCRLPECQSNILFQVVSHRNTFQWEIMTNECLFHSLFSIVKRKNVSVTELVH